MSRSKKVFTGFAVCFFLALIYLSYDISSRTTFPGSKPQLKERIIKQYLKQPAIPVRDTMIMDTSKSIHR
ncbi:MAG: hypothetical protein AABY93_07085 [Bacteroidota bacterium]